MEKVDKKNNSLKNSIIVATRNRLDDILVFLDSMMRQTLIPDEIVIVDSSVKPLIEFVKFTQVFSKNIFSKTNLIYKHTGPGLTYQRNVGINLACGDVFYFFDDDTVLEPNYIEKMDNIFTKFPEYLGGMGSVQGVAPRKITFRRCLRKMFLLQRDNSSGMFTFSGMPTHAYGNKRFQMVEVLGGCCMSYRSNVLKKHKFDEKLSFYSYMEDCDLSFRVSITSKLFFNPEAKLVHNHSPLARDKVEDNRAMYIRNYSYLFFKNIYPRNKLKLFAYGWSVFGLFFEALIYRNKSYLKGYFKGLKNFYISKEFNK